MSYIASLVGVFLVLCTVWSSGEHGPPIKTSQLMIGTVIDFSSADIVRDAVNMIKSARIFGGSMNEVTIVVGVVSSDSSSDSSKVIAMLTALNVELMFIPQSPPGQAKTLNKFRMFEAFDSIRFDYFLWLDADIFVFQDPMPFLRLHQYPGSIECVPDFYSYMRRFPAVNQSDVFWASEQSSFHLLGAGETAPHGICNTGVLYFDSQSLSRFTAGLQTILGNSTYLQLHGLDRFVDSLIFTEVVNRQNIEVTTLPHSLNYMALFEIEIQEELQQPADIVMAHFVSNSELYCITDAVDGTTASASASFDPTTSTATAATSATTDTAVIGTGCSCVYRNPLLPPTVSHLRNIIQEKILNAPHICHILAGTSLPAEWAKTSEISTCPPAEKGNEVVAVVAEDGRETTATEPAVVSSCALMSPPAQDAVLYVGVVEMLTLDVVVKCRTHPVVGVKSYPIILLRNSIYSENGAILHVSNVTVEPPLLERSEQDDLTYITHYQITFPATPPASPDRHHSSHLLRIENSVSGGIPTLGGMVNLTVVHNHRIPPGQVHYSSNPLLTAKATALESQLLLSEYLNDHHMRGTGVVVCCSTHKGVAAVKQLMRHWLGDFLLVVLESTPSWSEFEATESNISTTDSTVELAKLQQELHRHCQDANNQRRTILQCHIVTPPIHRQQPWSNKDTGLPFTRHLAHTLRPRSVSFVFVDWAAPHCELLATLRQFHSVLHKNGLLFGTHFALQRTAPRPSWVISPDSAHSPITVGNESTASVKATGWSSLLTLQHNLRLQQRHMRYAANALALQHAQSIQVIYAEQHADYCDAFMQLGMQDSDNRRLQRDSTAEQRKALWVEWECAPAWYLRKLRS